MNSFESAWTARKFSKNPVMRIFHGPTEGLHAEKDLAIDLFDQWAWVTVWEKHSEKLLPEVASFLREKNIIGAVVLDRSTPAAQSLPQVLFGTVPTERFPIQEGNWNLFIDFKNHRHPGLFLDLFPLREKLFQTQLGKDVLNLFCFTGSLSVASRAGGAKKVTSIDLSKTTIEWAKENWALNQFPPEESDFIYGDVFEWLQRFHKKQRTFDTVISDPPSFSRGKNGVFSTAKDLVLLHEALMKVVAPHGTLITIINSENVFLDQFEDSIKTAAANTGIQWKWGDAISISENFCGKKLRPDQSYLKGRILTR